MRTASTARTDSHGILLQTKPTVHNNPNNFQQFLQVPNKFIQGQALPYHKSNLQK
jgi:hypothetical protein